MMFNPWHNVDTGKESPKIINAIVEISKNSKVKYELDKNTGMLKLDRHVYLDIDLPTDYGFIPKTLWEDGDPLDICIFTNIPTQSMCLSRVKVIGVIEMKDDGIKDNKILAVHMGDQLYSKWNTIEDIPKDILNQLKEFFEKYKELDGIKVEIFDIFGPEKAYQDIIKAQEMYNEHFTLK